MSNTFPYGNSIEAAAAEPERPEEEPVKKRRVRIKLQDAPPVKSISDLIELGKSMKFYRNLDSITLWKVTPYLEELDRMVGMKSVKETVFYQVLYYLQGMHTRNSEGEYLHTAIYGPPGCGKTSVAEIIGKIYHALNILPSAPGTEPEIKKIGREDFVAGFLGQTSEKTRKFLKGCIGSVVVFDEIYSLAPRDKDRDSFAKEAIDTLNRFLSEHKNDFCFIIAGYEEEVINCFFAMNKGLKRRFPWIHRIEPYTYEEMAEIFILMIGKIGWSTSFSKTFMTSVFRENKDLFRYSGGDIETFLSKCKIMHSRRVFSLPAKNRFVLSEEDVRDALKIIRLHDIIDLPPPGMYA